MTLTYKVWDKTSPINDISAERAIANLPALGAEEVYLFLRPDGSVYDCIPLSRLPEGDTPEARCEAYIVAQEAVQQIAQALGLTNDEMADLRTWIRARVSKESDAEASLVPHLVADWEELIGKVYSAKDVAASPRPRVRHNDKLYAVIGAHTVTAEWTPESSPSLYEVLAYRKGYREIGNTISVGNPFSLGERGIDAKDIVWESVFEGANVYTPAQYAAYWKQIGKA
jgi:hypothetical protein